MARVFDTDPGGRGRHAAVSIALFVLLTAAFLWPVIVRGDSFTTMGEVGGMSWPWFTGEVAIAPVQADQAALSAPWQAELTRAVHDGTLPLWGEQFGGMPLYSNGASGQLYPPRLLTAALGLSPLRAHDVFTAVHLVGAGVASFLLLRELGVGRAAARVGAAAWMLCGFNLAWLHFEVLTPVMVLFPLALFALRRCVRVGTTPSVLAAGAVLAVTFTAGQLPFMVLVAFVALTDAACCAIARAVRGRSDGGVAVVKVLSRPVVAGVVGVGLAAVLLVPSAATLGAGNRDAVEFAQLDDPWAPTGEPIALDASTLPDVFVPSTETLSVASINHGQVFVGTLIAALAVVGVFVRRRGRWLGVALVVATVVTTVGGPVTWLAFHLNPILQYFRPYGRATFLIAMGVVVLGAVGLDALLRVLRDDDGHDPVDSTAARPWLRPAPAVAWAVLAVTAVQLVVHGHDLNPTFLPAGEEAMGETPFVEAVEAQQALDAWPARMMAATVAPGFRVPFVGNSAGLFGIDTLNGYDSSIPSRTVAIARHLEGEDYDAASRAMQVPFITTFPVRVDLAERLGVRTFGTAPHSPAPQPFGPDGEPRHIEAVYEGEDGSLFRITDAADPIRVVSDVEIVDGERDAFERFFAPDFDWVHTVVVEREDAAGTRVADLVAVADADERDVARARHVGVNTISIDVETARPGLVVVPTNWDDGWEATVDGAAADVMRVNYNQIAVPVPTGAVDVHLRYVPTGMRLGSAISGVTLVAVAGSLAAWVVRGRGRSGRHLR